LRFYILLFAKLFNPDSGAYFGVASMAYCCCHFQVSRVAV